VRTGTEIKHQTEDWEEYDARYLYDFVAPRTWHVAGSEGGHQGCGPGASRTSTRGLRYQCAARWTENTAYPEWSCSSHAADVRAGEPRHAPRRLRRARAHHADRGVRRQLARAAADNVKTIHRDGVRTPLVREVGKNWSVRLPDSECEAARAFARPRQAFWSLLHDVWDGVLNGAAPFVETRAGRRAPRFVKINEIEDDYLDRDLSDPALRKAARARIVKIIDAYRAPAPPRR